MKLLKLDHVFESGKFRNKDVKFVIESGESKYLNYFLSRNKDYRLHKDSIKLAQTKTELNFNQKLIDVLKAINSETSKKLLELNEKPVVSTFTKVKAYVRKPDIVVFDIPFGNKKNEIKIGRFVRKLFTSNNIEFKDKDIEDFVTDYFGAINGNFDYKFEIVKGERIRELYNEENYDKATGSLGNSCMRYSWCASSFDLYAKNPEVEMLVLFNKKSGKVAGRAILWKKADIKYYMLDDESKSLKKYKGSFMDRIYVNNSKHTSLFKKYAKKESIICKSRQSYSSKPGLLIDGKKAKGRIEVNVSDAELNKPYLDTVAWVESSKSLSNGCYRNW